MNRFDGKTDVELLIMERGSCHPSAFRGLLGLIYSGKELNDIIARAQKDWDDVEIELTRRNAIRNVVNITFNTALASNRAAR